MNEEKIYNYTLQCVQCGYCLPVCPTYLTMKKETLSPRGRINLVKMVLEKRITAIEKIAEPFHACVGCRNCETACPVGVPYHKILSFVKEGLNKEAKHSLWEKMIRNIVFRRVFPKQKVMLTLNQILYIYEKSGLRYFSEKSGILKLFPEYVEPFHYSLPKQTKISLSFKLNRKEEDVRADLDHKNTLAQNSYRIAFFHGCVMEGIYKRINDLTLQLLRMTGHEIVIPKGQTCCGAIHNHQGERAIAKELAKKNIEVFLKSKADFVVNNAGGCGAQLKEYDELLLEEENWQEKVKEFVGKIRDISQILAISSPLPYKKEIKGIVTYQRSCHMTNVSKVTHEPLQLIKSIPKINFVEMEDPHLCCGSGGVYNIFRFHDSMQILERKMNSIKNTNATTVVTTNPGCLLQINAGIFRARRQGEIRAIHLVELLAEAVGII